MQFEIYRTKENELIEGCKKRESHAQRQLYDRFSGKMYALCNRYVKDKMEAEDVLVSSFTKVFERIDQYKGEGSFEGWLRKVVVNESLSYLRKNKNMYLETDIEAIDHEPDFETIDTQLETEDLLKMINALPTGYRIVFNMYAIDGFSHKEIASHLGINENTSKSQLSRARAMLQRNLLTLEREWIKKIDGI